MLTRILSGLRSAYLISTDIQNTAHTNVRFLVRASYLQIYSKLTIDTKRLMNIRIISCHIDDAIVAHHCCWCWSPRSLSYFSDEVISDLLKPERSNLAIREDKKKGSVIESTITRTTSWISLFWHYDCIIRSAESHIYAQSFLSYFRPSSTFIIILHLLQCIRRRSEWVGRAFS